MSKPRWIDGGVFKTLRAATRTRTLAVVVGPEHGTAEISSRASLKEVLGDGDRAALADDPRLRSEPDEGLRAVFALKQPGVVTTAVSNALMASWPPGREETVRLFGPDSKGLQSAWERKDTFVVHLAGAPEAPETLVLTGRDRKALTRPDSRYQNFLRATFSRTVLFTGFRLGDPDLDELLDDVSRVFNGHVPPNTVLVPAGSADPAAALRARMHYGMSLIEFPAELTAGSALSELAGVLEELEVPRPATGDPPSGFTELTADMRAGVSPADAEQLALFDGGDSSGWAFVAAGADGARDVAGAVREALLAEAPEGKVPVVLVRGRSGEGKTTLGRRLAWDLAGEGPRVFWREGGVGLPDRYVPAEPDDARAVFVLDDASELATLPVLLRDLAGRGQGKVRFLLAADASDWSASGLDHRVGQHAALTEVLLDGVSAAEAAALAEGLAARGRLPEGTTAEQAASQLVEGEGVLMDRIARVVSGGDVASAAAALVQDLGARGGREELLRRALLATAMVHRHGMSLSRPHLAALVGLDVDELPTQVLEPLRGVLMAAGPEAVRTAHPLMAVGFCEALLTSEEVRDAMAIDLLRTLPEGGVTDHMVLGHPSELIRALRQSPMAPLTVARFFEAGEHAARNDVQFWFDRGRSEADFSRWEPALTSFEHALRARPADAAEKEHNALVHLNRARCLAALGRKKDALRATEEGIRFSPRDGSLLKLHEKLGGRRSPRRGGRGGDAGGPGRGRRGGGRREGGGRGGAGPGGGAGGQGGGGRPAQRRGPPAGSRPGS